MKRLLVGSLAVIVLWMPSSVAAHHSPAVFDRTKEIKLVGVVKEFKWSNPHSWIELDVRNEKGVMETWGVEMNPPSYLIKAGWKRTSIKAGDEVTIMVHPLRNGEKGGQFRSITLPNGQVLGERDPLR
ncbi:MAG: DUF6152 family protein [Vicinamibacterales bacterium]